MVGAGRAGLHRLTSRLQSCWRGAPLEGPAGLVAGVAAATGSAAWARMRVATTTKTMRRSERIAISFREPQRARAVIGRPRRTSRKEWCAIQVNQTTGGAL